MSANKKPAKTLELVKWANFCCGQIDDYLFLGWRRGSLPRQGRTQDFNWGAMKYLCLSHMIGGEGGLFDRGLKWGVVPPLPLYQPSPASPRQLTASKWCVASPLSPIMEPWHSTYHECLYSDQGRPSKSEFIMSRMKIFPLPYPMNSDLAKETSTTITPRPKC